MFQSVITFSLEDNLDSLLATTATGCFNVRQDGLPYMGMYDPIMWSQVRSAMSDISPRKREKILRKWCRQLADMVAEHFGDHEKWGRHYVCATAYWQFANDLRPWQPRVRRAAKEPLDMDALIRGIAHCDGASLDELAAHCRTLDGDRLAGTLCRIADRLSVATSDAVADRYSGYGDRHWNISCSVETAMENLWFNIAPVEEQRCRYAIHAVNALEHAKLLGIY